MYAKLFETERNSENGAVSLIMHNLQGTGIIRISRDLEYMNQALVSNPAAFGGQTYECFFQEDLRHPLIG